MLQYFWRPEVYFVQDKVEISIKKLAPKLLMTEVLLRKLLNYTMTIRQSRRSRRHLKVLLRQEIPLKPFWTLYLMSWDQMPRTSSELILLLLGRGMRNIWLFSRIRRRRESNGWAQLIRNMSRSCRTKRRGRLEKQLKSGEAWRIPLDVSNL